MDSSSSPSQRPGFLERLSHLLMREPEDREQLLVLLHSAFERNLLDADALSIIEGALQVSDMPVREVMIPRAQMDVIDIDDPLDKIVQTALRTAHSRFPVIGENRDDVIGILLAKDLLRLMSGDDDSLRDMLRPAVFIPESKRLNVLLREFRASRNHMAIVVDEYGGVAGLITIEDVLEEIVGEIDDEHDTDDDSAFIRSQGDSFIVKALTPVEDFNAYFQATLSDERADTVGGLVMMELGRLPKGGETVDLDRFHFRVLRADNRRIHLLETSLHDGQEAAPPATENN